MSRQATKKRKAAAKPVHVVCKPAPHFAYPESLPTGKTPNPEAFKRGHGMGSSFLDAFPPDEMRDGLQGFNAAIREHLRLQMKKIEAHLEHLHDAIEVVEER